MILTRWLGFVIHRRANPLANVALLFRRDPGLRSLAAACSCYFLCQSNWSIAASYRMGVLGMLKSYIPAHIRMSLYGVRLHACRVVASAIFVFQHSFSVPLVTVSTGACVAVYGPSRKPQGF
eukprot:COSAG02_NODE_331_length_24480_cov_22.114720_2_plen_122_part_00